MIDRNPPAETDDHFFFPDGILDLQKFIQQEEKEMKGYQEGYPDKKDQQYIERLRRRQEYARKWATEFDGKIPNLWQIWHRVGSFFKKINEAGISVSDDLVNIAILYPDNRVVADIGLNYPLNPTQLAAVLMRTPEKRDRHEIFIAQKRFGTVRKEQDEWYGHAVSYFDDKSKHLPHYDDPEKEIRLVNQALLEYELDYSIKKEKEKHLDDLFLLAHVRHRKRENFLSSENKGGEALPDFVDATPADEKLVTISKKLFIQTPSGFKTINVNTVPCVDQAGLPIPERDQEKIQVTRIQDQDIPNKYYQIIVGRRNDRNDPHYYIWDDTKNRLVRTPIDFHDLQFSSELGYRIVGRDYSETRFIDPATGQKIGKKINLLEDGRKSIPVKLRGDVFFTSGYYGDEQAVELAENIPAVESVSVRAPKLEFIGFWRGILSKLRNPHHGKKKPSSDTQKS